MNRLEYFKARLDATMSPMDLHKILAENPGSVCIVDVRNGPADLLQYKIAGAKEIAQEHIEKRCDELPKDKLIIVYCWETWCTLAAKSAVPLLEKGYDVKELFGGLTAWMTLQLPVEPVTGFDDSKSGLIHDSHGGSCCC